MLPGKRSRTVVVGLALLLLASSAPSRGQAQLRSAPVEVSRQARVIVTSAVTLSAAAVTIAGA